MPRCRVVAPEVVRLYLVDVHRRELDRVRGLLAEKKASEEDVTVALDKVRQAEDDAEWVDVRKRLNAGENRAMLAQMYLAGIDGRLRVNPLTQGMAKITAYLLDWSMVAPDGKKIPIEGLPSEAVTRALDKLDPDTVAEIREAIYFHEEAVEKEKNAMAGTGARSTSAISASAA